ncbi:hypothetical protein HN011_002120 [Eciton burchellii]|nr:hypothetical protein HN011_002120 [Eciton burchellii]
MVEDLRNFLVDQTTTIGQIKRVIINYKKLLKANVILQKMRSHLADLQMLEEDSRSSMVGLLLRQRMRKKKLSYFLQDEFLATDDAYNEAADYLQKAISNFVKMINLAYDHSTDSTFCDETKSSSLKLPCIVLPTFSVKFSE